MTWAEATDLPAEDDFVPAMNCVLLRHSYALWRRLGEFDDIDTNHVPAHDLMRGGARGARRDVAARRASMTSKIRNGVIYSRSRAQHVQTQRPQTLLQKRRRRTWHRRRSCSTTSWRRSTRTTRELIPHVCAIASHPGSV